MDINFPLTQLLVNGTNCFYVILDAQGIIRFANRLFIERICDQETIMEKTSFFHCIETCDKVRVEKEIESILHSENALKEFESTHKIISGKSIRINWNAVRKTISDVEELHCLGVEYNRGNENKDLQKAPEIAEKILELKSLNNSLEKRAAELASSNEELERFAYVASHDLQEPLRMVSSFLQLLQKRYNEKLDSKANEYIHFAVDGAERMKILILDLLKFSRVNSTEVHEAVDVNEICKSILHTHSQKITQTKATIHLGDLPIVYGSKTEVLQLFQNIISNALKYNAQNPVIHVTATDIDTYWQFAIADNGIGIDKRFFKKIFVIFQRLHHRNEYSGTGIGLAICKKIVERHGGNIWVESTPDEGSTFYFTLPKLSSEASKKSKRQTKPK